LLIISPNRKEARRRMRKILTVVAVAGLICFAFLIPLREAGADIIDFTSTGMNGTSVSTTLIEPAWVYEGVSVRANSSLLVPRVSVNPEGLGVLGGSNTDRSVNNGQIGIPLLGYTPYAEGLLLYVPESFYFTSITLSGLGEDERALVRVVADWDLGDILDALTGDSLTGFAEVSSNLPVSLGDLFGDNDWQWLLVRTPLFTEASSSSFYVAQVEIQPIQAVPEPSALILLGCGLIGIGVFRRISKRG
jgi:hypothetical protein